LYTVELPDGGRHENKSPDPGFDRFDAFERLRFRKRNHSGRSTDARSDGASEFANFREAVFTDCALAEKLRACVNREELAACAIELGTVAGYRFSAADVHAAMHEGRRRWISQWIV
jgi:hypothetical protein